MSDDKNIKLSIPGEWALEKALGPTLEAIGVDFVKLYNSSKIGVSKIAIATKNKLGKSPAKNQKTNLRVTRDVFWNGAFSEEDICAEYFGGVLAGSRSSDGKSDSGIFYLDLIKSLSSNQLRLHYFIYLSLNRHLVGDPSFKNLNVAVSEEIQGKPVFFITQELISMGIDIGVDLLALYSKGLINIFSYNTEEHPDKHHLTKVTPTTLGVQLFAVAANMLPKFREFVKIEFTNFNYSEPIPKTALSALELIPTK